MSLARGLIAAVVFACLAVGVAPPASAVDQPPQGIYSYHEEGGLPYRWELWPVCVVAGCLVHVIGTVPGEGPMSDTPPFSGDARLSGGRWTFMVTNTTGVTCPDGSKETGYETFAFDQATLAGTHTVFHEAVCGLQPAMTKSPFTLAYEGPLPTPVILDPLNQIPELW